MSMKYKLVTLWALLLLAGSFTSAKPADSVPAARGVLIPAEALVPPPPGAGSAFTMSVSITYDFSKTNGCSQTVTSGCVKQFNIYNTTGGGKVLLFSVGAPAGATTSQLVTGTSGSTFTIQAGVFSFAVTAATPDPVESAPFAGTMTVPPAGPTACTATFQ